MNETDPIDLHPSPSPARQWRLPSWWRYAAAGAAALALALAAVLVAFALNGRAGGQGPSATVVPPAPDVQTSAAQQAGAASAAAAGAAADSRAAAPAAQGSATSQLAPYPIVGTSCSASPTVQFQGRGLAATGTAAITGSEQMGTVSVTVQQTGSDAVAALGAVQARIAAVRDALAKVGVPASSVQVSYVRTYGDSHQFTAYASLQATVTGADALAAATKAVTEVAGVTAYSQSSPVAGEPTPEQVQNAVGRAAAQAKDMATSTAAAAGVRLGDVQSVVAQPPVTCYGPSGPQRVVQVTAMYAIR